MPPKRRTRAVSRIKPVLANATNNLIVIDSKEKQRRALLIEDFHRNAALRMEMIQEEARQLEASLWKSYEIYRQQLLPWQHINVKQLLEGDDVDSIPKPVPQASKRGKNLPATTGLNTAAASGLCGDQLGELPSSTSEDTELPSISTNTGQSSISATIEAGAQVNLTEAETAQSASPSAASAQESACPSTLEHDPPGTFAVPRSVAPKGVRMSEISALIAEGSKLTGAKPKKKKKACNTPAAPLSATRSSSRLHGADGPSAHLAPHSSGRSLRAKRGEGGMFVTPAGQRVPAKPGSQLLVTPKFDPRVPLPPNTLLRRPLPREVPMSITGSPLSLSPDKPKLKEIMGEFLETLERDVPSLDHKDIRQFHSVLQRHLDRKP